MRIAAHHIAGVGEPRTGREEGLEGHHSLTVAAEHRTVAGRLEEDMDCYFVEDMGCYSVEDNVLVGGGDCFREVLPGRHRHNHRSSLATADIGRPEGDSHLHFEEDIRGIGLEEAGIGPGEVEVDRLGSLRGDIGCTSRSQDNYNCPSRFQEASLVPNEIPAGEYVTCAGAASRMNRVAIEVVVVSKDSRRGNSGCKCIRKKLSEF